MRIRSIAESDRVFTFEEDNQPGWSLRGKPTDDLIEHTIFGSSPAARASSVPIRGGRNAERARLRGHTRAVRDTRSSAERAAK